MKKQITLALGAMLFTGAYLRAEETTATPVVPETKIETPAGPSVVAPADNAAVVTPDASIVTPDAKSADVAKKSYVPSFAQAKAWCVNHKLIVLGTASVVGFAVLWKTCPAFRAFFGVEDEQEQEKFVY